MLTRVLPDVTSHAVAETPSSLKWVGMENIAVPITISDSENRNQQALVAKANVYVSLEAANAKGIHMSRLHSVINRLADHDCNRKTISHLLNEMIQSQLELGQAAKIELSFDLLLEKAALLSDESGFQAYPVTLNAEKNESGLRFEFGLTIPYSSTCPCSASLARQLYANAIDKEFSGESIDKESLLEWVQSRAGSVATPHSQRSYAYIRLSLGDGEWPDLKSLIEKLENTIGTPVQTAVKRRDEQEFARLNAENLMFCEDAARRIKLALENMSLVQDYWFKVEHQESLHAHNAVVIDQKFETYGENIGS